MTLTEFLLARIAEDEREARVCLDQHRRGEGGSRRRWERVLAECEAKRRIVEEYTREQWVQAQGHRTEWTEGGQAARESVLRALAAVYADHPSFDPTWAVE